MKRVLIVGFLGLMLTSYAAGRESVTVEVDVKWPHGRSADSVTLILIPSEEGQKVLRAMAEPNGKAVFNEVAAGEYRLMVDELTAGAKKIWLDQPVTVKANGGVKATAVLAAAEVCDIKVIGVHELDKSYVSGKVRYWHHPANVAEVELPQMGVSLSMVATARYHVEVIPSSVRLVSVTEGPVNPAGHSGKITVAVPDAAVLYSYDWEIAEEHLPKVPVVAMYPTLMRADGNGTFLPFEDREFASSPYVNGKTRGKREVFRLPDGKYQLSGKLTFGENCFANAMLPQETIFFEVKRGKATPAHGRLIFSSAQSARLAVKVIGNDGAALPLAPVRLIDLPEARKTVWEGQTAADGTVELPPVLSGDYNIKARPAVGHGALFSKDIKLAPGKHDLVVDFRQAVTVTVQVLDSDGRPTRFHGSWVSRHEIRERSTFIAKDGLCRRMFFPSQFPLLLFGTPGNGKDLLRTIAVNMTEPPSGVITVRESRHPVRKFSVTLPAEIMRGKRYFAADLWLTKDADIAPIARLVLPSLAFTPELIKNLADSGVTVETAGRVPVGKFRVLVHVSGDGGARLIPGGTVTIPEEGDVTLKLVGQDVKDQSTPEP